MNKYIAFFCILVSSLIFSCTKPKTSPGPKPIASFELVIDSINSYKVTFISTTTNNATSYSWNFGDASAVIHQKTRCIPMQHPVRIM